MTLKTLHKSKGLRYSLTILLFCLLLFYPFRTHWASRYLSYRTQMNVSIDHLSFIPDKENKGRRCLSIEGLKVDNPRGSLRKTALKIDSLSLFFRWRELFRKKAVIDKLRLRSVYLSVLFSPTSPEESNWTHLVGSRGNDKASASGGKSTYIRKLQLEDVQVELSTDGKEIKKLASIPKITFRDIDTKAGLHSKAIAQLIIHRLFSSLSTRQGLENLTKSLLLDTPKKSVKQALKPLKWLFSPLTKKNNTRQAPLENSSES